MSRSQDDRDDDTSQTCPQLLQVVVECQSEQQQRELYEEMLERGLPCRLLML